MYVHIPPVYHRDLVSDLQAATAGLFRQLVTSLAQGLRAEGSKPVAHQTEADAEALHKVCWTTI